MFGAVLPSSVLLVPLSQVLSVPEALARGSRAFGKVLLLLVSPLMVLR
ncbi:hypothetical protein [Actinokineospora iranica]|nr:hypothetical protein [Actinokineospora iranica]